LSASTADKKVGATGEPANSMDERAVISGRTVEVLQQIRSNARQLARKEKSLDEVKAKIADGETTMMSLADEFQSEQSEQETQEIQDAINEVGSRVEELDVVKAKLAKELVTHKAELPYLRECLEDELWRTLVESGQLGATDNSSSNPVVHCDDPGDQAGVGAEKSSSANEVTNSEDCRIRKAMSLLNTTKDDLRAALEKFQDLDRLCEVQRRNFETRAIPEWHEMSRTEFDVEQVAQKMEQTRELIRAQKAYSEAGRYAVEVGLIRDDPDQSCHFLDDADDGACSGDRYATFMEENDITFIEHWRERISAPCSSPSAERGDDVWEVDSVHFGEGCSTHAEELDKIRIDRWDELRERERKRMRMTGNAASPDELLCRHTPALDSQGSSALSEPAENPNAGGNPRAGFWKPSFAAVKELMISGQAAVARLSPPWSSHRVGEN
jgi:hypothetical protein